MQPHDPSPVQGDPPALDDLLAGRRVALFLDVDGTLIALAPTPDSIKVPGDLAGRLADLGQRLSGACALISGRALGDLETYLGRPLPLAAAGSHGADVRGAAGEALGDTPGAPPADLAQALRDFAAQNGLRYEEKAHGAALHYRQRPQAEAAALAFARELAQRFGWQVQTGKCVVELVEGRADKGTAVRALMASEPFTNARPIFLGDDTTDEAGFAACEALGGFGVAVGERESDRARYHLADVDAVHAWLGL
ncbi:MAG: trehalose-phosphatase [Pseudomonadota bacterium]